MAPGHMNPMIDMAKLFTLHGVKTTILTTPANAPLIQPTINLTNQSTNPITVLILPFPAAQFSLPPDCENLASITSPELKLNFLKAISTLRQPFNHILTNLSPDCVISDAFLPWTNHIAAEHGIRRLVFHGMGYFALCAQDSLARHKPEGDPILLPGLPHRIEMQRSQIPDSTKIDPAFVELISELEESEARSYGVVVNSFYELEAEYVEHYNNVVGRKAWHVGPVSLCGRDEVDSGGCLNWLEGKQAGSVVYVCFGSLSEFSRGQLREIAIGLEASGHLFIWVVREQGEDDGLPKRYVERIEGRGLIVKGWAPQILILNHYAVGGLVTHCGWNTTLEGVSAGVPFVTWPLFAEQFYNERLIVDVLGIGVSVGAKEYEIWPEERAVVEAAEIEKAVNEMMSSTGEAAARRRRRARELGEKARRAVEEGGSSYLDMENLIKELKNN